MKAKPEEIMKEYKLPDNNIIHIGNPLFRALETLFLPANIGVEAPGVHHMIFNSIMKRDIDVRRSLYGNILLSGGSTLFPGMEERILKEMKLQAPAGMFVRIVAAPERKYCCMTSSKPMWVT
ncbi:uncharacterized protein FYW35_010005 [Pterocles gutturalis]